MWNFPIRRTTATRRPLTARIVFLLALAAAVACAHAEQDASADTAGTAAKTRPKVGLFRDKDGNLMVTNRVGKYLRRSDYRPIEIKFEKVAIPDRFRKLDLDAARAPAAIATLVKRYARKYGLDTGLVYAVIKVESDFDPKARSPKGACGLMQLMPGTAAEMGVSNIFDPAQNIAGGTQYLAKLLKAFNNDLGKTLAAYNAGPTVVQRHNGVPPYKETQDYVRDVIDWMQRYARDGVDLTYLAQVYKPGPRSSSTTAVRPRPAPMRARKKHYTVHFHSGLAQPADEVTDKGQYYVVRFGNYEYRVPKEHVRQIAAPA